MRINGWADTHFRFIHALLPLTRNGCSSWWEAEFRKWENRQGRLVITLSFPHKSLFIHSGLQGKAPHALQIPSFPVKCRKSGCLFKHLPNVFKVSQNNNAVKGHTKPVAGGSLSPPPIDEQSSPSYIMNTRSHCTLNIKEPLYYHKAWGGLPNDPIVTSHLGVSTH